MQRRNAQTGHRQRQDLREGCSVLLSEQIEEVLHNAETQTPVTDDGKVLGKNVLCYCLSRSKRSYATQKRRHRSPTTARS